MKCALIEYNSHHDITFPIFCYILNKLNIEVDVYTTQQSILRNSLYNSDCNNYKIINIESKFSSIKQTLFKFNNYDFIIANSLEPISLLDKFKNFKVPTIGVIHHGGILKQNRNYIEYFSKPYRIPLFISKHVSHYISGKHSNDWIFPVYFGEINPYKKKSDKIVFCVQGMIEFTRRNYYSLIEAVIRLKSEGFQNFEILLIGGYFKVDRDLIKKLIKDNNIESFFDIVESDVPYQVYYNRLLNSDYLLPLLDQSNDNFLNYYGDRMTTSLCLAIGLNIIPIIEKKLSNIFELSLSSIPYNTYNLYDALKVAISLKGADKSILKSNLYEYKNKYIDISAENLKTNIEKVISQ